jgi:hypothetical protein
MVDYLREWFNATGKKLPDGDTATSTYGQYWSAVPEGSPIRKALERISPVSLP